MAKAKGSLVPIRGSVEDWGPGKHQRNLERKETYAKRMQEQVAKGPPDFDSLLSLGVSPSESAEVPKKRRATGARKKKATRKSAKKAKKTKKTKKTRSRR
jgi:hypothetical protein